MACEVPLRTNLTDLREHVSNFDLEAIGMLNVPLIRLRTNLRILELEGVSRSLVLLNLWDKPKHSDFPHYYCYII